MKIIHLANREICDLEKCEKYGFLALPKALVQGGMPLESWKLSQSIPRLNLHRNGYFVNRNRTKNSGPPKTEKIQRGTPYDFFGPFYKSVPMIPADISIDASRKCLLIEGNFRTIGAFLRAGGPKNLFLATLEGYNSARVADMPLNSVYNKNVHQPPSVPTQSFKKKRYKFLTKISVLEISLWEIPC
jgi:hypothetical protein